MSWVKFAIAETIVVVQTMLASKLANNPPLQAAVNALVTDAEALIALL